MARFPALISTFALLLATNPARAEPASAGGLTAAERARVDLSHYYAPPNEQPPYSAALDSLASPAESHRRDAGQYLLELFRQSAADEVNGRSRWVQPPYWGAGPQSPTRELRQSMATAFGERASGAEASPALEWLITSEKIGAIQSSGAKALARLPVDSIQPLLQRILSRGHPRADVLVFALQRAAEDHIVSLGPDVVRWCADYRSSVRVYARAAAASLGLVVPATSDTLTLQPWMKDALHRVLEREFWPVPRTARWTLAALHLHRDGSSWTWHCRGWLTAETDSTIQIVSEFGVLRTLPRDSTTLSPGSLAEEAARIVAVREADGKAVELSSEGDLTAQFEPSGIRLPEALVAAWCEARGDSRSAAAILVPRLDALGDAAAFDRITRNLQGTLYDKEMMKAFSYRRDYAATIAYGEHLAKPIFDGYAHQTRARLLAEQLHRRSDDFRTFTLPDSTKWRALRGRLDRKQQIDYWAARLRLLNSYEGVNPELPQKAQPWNFDEIEGDKPNTSQDLINPLAALYSMNLTPADIPALVPWLTDADFAPSFSYWREFAPDWDLVDVAQLIEGVINATAHQSLAHAETARMLAPGARRAYLDSLAQWGATRPHASADDLTLELLATTRDANQFEAATREAARRHISAAVPIVMKRHAEFADWDWLVAQYLYDLDSPEWMSLAREWLRVPLVTYEGMYAEPLMQASASANTHFYAAMGLLTYGDSSKNEGLDALMEVLLHDREGEWLKRATEVFVKMPDPRQMNALCAAAVGLKPALGSAATSGLLRRMFLLGCPDVRSKLLRDFENSEACGSISAPDKLGHHPKVVSFTTADVAATMIASWKIGAEPYRIFAPDTTRARRRAQLREWLIEQGRRLDRGETPDMLDADLAKSRRVDMRH